MNDRNATAAAQYMHQRFERQSIEQNKTKEVESRTA